MLSFVNISNATNVADKKWDYTLMVFEAIESTNPNKIKKTADELIAQYNAIIGNNISNKSHALDFFVINSKSIISKDTNYK